MAEGLAIPATSLRRAGSSTAVAMASLLVKLGNQLRVGRGQGEDTPLPHPLSPSTRVCLPI